MAISIRKRKDRNLWEARAKIRGKWTSSYADSEAGAIEKARAKIAEAESLPEIITDRTIGGFLVLQIKPLYESRAAKHRSHASLFLRTINAGIGHIECDRLTLADCQKLMDEYAKTHAHGSCANLRKYLFQMCRYLARAGRIRWNYGEDIRNPVKPARRKAPTATQAVWLLESARGHWTEPLIYLCFVLGLRREEACCVQVEDVSETELFVRGTKTGNAERTIPLPAQIAADLLGFAAESKRFLVETPSGVRLANNWSKIIKAAYDWSGLDRFDYHGLRHAFGSIQTELGCPEPVRMAILGQSTRHVRLLYTHASDMDARLWLERWWDFLTARRAECLREVCGYAVGTEFVDGVEA